MDCYTKFFIEHREGESPEMREVREQRGRALIAEWWRLENADREYSYMSQEDWEESFNWYYEGECERMSIALDRDLSQEEEKECEKLAKKKMTSVSEKRDMEKELIVQQLEGIGWKRGDVFDDYNEEAPYWRMMEQRALDREGGRW